MPNRVSLAYMRTAILTAIPWFALVFAAYGQQLSVGVVGGTNITTHFPNTDITTPADGFGNPANRFQYMSGSRSLILGALVEVRLREDLSIEANILHRPLHSKIIYTEFFANGASQAYTDHFTAVRAWEFPVMLKYTLPSLRSAGRVRPFLEVGPSFRTQEDALATQPSQFGISAGIGAAFHLGPFRLAPSLRYTRWARESIYPGYATKPGQIELLTAISYATSPSSWRVKARRIRLGVVAGTPFTGGLDRGPEAMPYVSELRGYMAGLSVDLELNRRLSVEVDGIYRPYRGFDLGYAHDGRIWRSEFTVLTWQFPVLAKLNLRPSTKFQPIFEAGPSFRLNGNAGDYNPSRLGLTVGAGIETKVGRLAIGPVVRYTRWAQDTNPHEHSAGSDGGPRTSQDQVELLVKFFF